MARRVRSLRCPTCRKLVLRTEPEYPFCSRRCRLIDLGKWASGAYVISTPIRETDQYGEAEYAASARSSENAAAPPPKSNLKTAERHAPRHKRS
jgi:endogenous inhibitor of DNA gyrase (YacG/DUF329 family)